MAIGAFTPSDAARLLLRDPHAFLPPSIFGSGLSYGERICLGRWVSGLEPVAIYRSVLGQHARMRAFVGLGVKGGDGSVVVHAPPTDKFYLDSGTGYPPDWNFYKGERA